MRSSSVSSSCEAMSLNVLVRTPISSFEGFSTLSVKSPDATFSAAWVSSCMGAIMVLASNRLRNTDMTRPTASASTIISSSWSFRLRIVSRSSII